MTQVNSLDSRVPRSLDRIPREIVIPDDAVCVFVSGSLVAGWGHASSDVDLYVVTSTPAPMTPTASFELGLTEQPIPVVAAFGPDGMRYDVEYWTTTQVDELLTAVDRRDDRNHALAMPVTRDDIDCFFRLDIGVAITGEEWLRAAKERLGRSALPVILAGQEFHEADGFVEDALGLVEVGDQESAVLAARAALDHAVDGYLFAHRSFSPGVKWRYRKLAGLPAGALSAEAYWRLATMRELDPADVRPWVERVAELCQSLMMEVDFS
jgi:hypothetical protein